VPLREPNGEPHERQAGKADLPNSNLSRRLWRFSDTGEPLSATFHDGLSGIPNPWDSSSSALDEKLLDTSVRSLDYKGEVKAIQGRLAKKVKSFTNSWQGRRRRVPPRNLADFFTLCERVKLSRRGDLKKFLHRARSFTIQNQLEFLMRRMSIPPSAGLRDGRANAREGGFLGSVYPVRQINRPELGR
jgi:hypothetical protein